MAKAIRWSLQALLRLLHGAERAALAWFLLVMIVLGVAQVILRRFGAALLWADPAIRYSVLWIGFIAAAVATRHGRHISVDALSRFLPPRPARISAIVADAAAAAITAVLFVASTCAFLPAEAGARLLAPFGWFLPESIFATWLEYLVGDEGVAFVITLGPTVAWPVADWLASLVVPLTFSMISLRFFSRALLGILGVEVPRGGEEMQVLDAEPPPAEPGAEPERLEEKPGIARAGAGDGDEEAAQDQRRGADERGEALPPAAAATALPPVEENEARPGDVDKPASEQPERHSPGSAEIEVPTEPEEDSDQEQKP